MHLKQWWMFFYCNIPISPTVPIPRSVLYIGVTAQVAAQVIRCRKFLPCPCTAPFSGLPASGRAVWVAVSCTPPEKSNQERTRWSETTKRPLCFGETVDDYFEERRTKRRRDWVILKVRNRGGREYPVREGGSTTSVREKPKVCYSCTERDCLN